MFKLVQLITYYVQSLCKGVIPKSLPVLLTKLILSKMAVDRELQLSTG